MSEEISAAISYLENVPEGCDASILAHTGRVLVRVADFAADRPIDHFEAFSYILKEEQSPAVPENLASIHETIGPDFISARRERSLTNCKLFARQKLTAEGEEEEEEPEQKHEEEEAAHEEEEMVNEEGEVPNVAADMNFMRSVGIGLTRDETLLLEQAVHKLIRSRPLATARFWGKVQCSHGSYYICEAEYSGDRPKPETHEEEEEKKDEKEPPMEEETGPNTNVYFVCTELGGKWIMLPDLLPKQIVASRSIKQMFTGDLDSDVIAPPGRFPWKERELLRCFIARVVHSCTLAPKGLYNPEEEPEEDMPLESNAPLVMDEEWVPKPLAGVEGFLHRLPCILPQGRTEFWAPEPEEEEKDPYIEKGIPILTPITQDEPIEGGIPSWSVRILRTPQKKFWLRSNAWPGLNIVSSETGERMVMMYFGWGMKATAPLEWPPLPPPKETHAEEEEEEEEEKDEKEDADEGESKASGMTESTYDDGDY